MKKYMLYIGTILLIFLFIGMTISVAGYSDKMSTHEEDDHEHIIIPKDVPWYNKPSDYDELVSWYENLESQFPDYIEVFKANELYGTNQATGGYDLYYIRITNESNGFDKPEVLFLGSPHGDETAGTIGMYWFADWLMRKAYTDEACMDYSKDWLRWLVENREIYFEISHNPYGFDHDQRYDGNGWDLNREADYDGPGSPTGGIWASENGKTLRRFMDNHTIRVGCDFHGGVRALIYPWAGTHLGVSATSPISGYTNEGAPPDFYFYDASSLRVGSYMGNCCGDGVFDEDNVQTIAEYIWYAVYGGIGPWAYGADVIDNPAEDSYVEDEIFGNYPGAGALWMSPELSNTKNVPEFEMGNDTVDGWGTEVRRYILHQTDIAQPYVRWQPGTIEEDVTVAIDEPFTVTWQVNGSMVVDHTSVQWGSNPDPVNIYEFETEDHDIYEGQYIGGTGWDDAEDGMTNGVIYSEEIAIETPGDYYFVAKAQVDQIYADVISPETYGDNPYLRLIKERTNDSYYESIDGTDGLEEINGQTWWYSSVIHVSVEQTGPDAQYSWEDVDGAGSGTLISFDASLSTGENIVLYEWDWNSDGVYDYTDITPYANHDYGDSAAHQCTLRITDETSQSDTITDTVQANLLMDVNQPLIDRGFPIRHALDGDWAGAQNFTPTLNHVSKVELYLRVFGTPEFDMMVELRLDGPQGTLLDSEVFTPGEVPTSWTWFEVDFEDQYVGIGSDVFVVIPPAPSGVTTSFGYEWGYAFGNQYDYGSFWFTRDGGGLWRDLPDIYEFAFRTYGYE